MPEYAHYQPFMSNWGEVYYGALNPALDPVWLGTKKMEVELPKVSKAINEKFFSGKKSNMALLKREAAFPAVPLEFEKAGVAYTAYLKPLSKHHYSGFFEDEKGRSFQLKPLSGKPFTGA